MFKLNKNVAKKLGVVSVSALMLLGVGAGMTSAHTNVHADALSAQMHSNAKTGAYNYNKDLYNHIKNDPQYALQVKDDDPGAYNEVVQEFHYHLPANAAKKYPDPFVSGGGASEDSSAKTLEKDNADVAQMENHSTQTKATINQAKKHSNTKSQAKIAKKNVKHQIKRVHKAHKHAKKSTTKASLTKQIRSLKRELRNLENKMNKLTHKSTHKTHKHANRRHMNKRTRRTHRTHRARK